MKALQSVRRANQYPKRLGKVHPQVREGLVKIGEKVGYRLGLALLPDFTKHLGLGTYIILGLMVVNRTGIDQNGLFADCFRFALGLVITRLTMHRQITVEQVISNSLDLVKDAALVRHPIEMLIERLLKPLSPIADHKLGRLLGHPFGRELPTEGLPGR